MLDFLVRVSRRVGWGADIIATNPCNARLADPPALTPHTESRTGHCKQSPPVDGYRRTGQLDAARAPRSRNQSATPRTYKFHSPKRLATLSGYLWWSRKPLWRSAKGKCVQPSPREPAAHARKGHTPPEVATSWIESPKPTLRSLPFTCKRFHVLSNSLFKVLFNFPSRYLFAIGLVPVFSLRWSLPPTLGCILKQPDSKERPSDDAQSHIGLTPAMGQASLKRTQTMHNRLRDTPKPHSS